MTNKEKILSEIERLMYAYNLEADIAASEDAIEEKIAQEKYELCKRMLSFINSLPEEPVSEDLDEAAEVYGYTNWQSDDYHEGAAEGLPFDAIGHTEKCFKDGAQWNNERVIKKACNWLKKHGGFTLGFPGAEVKDFLKYMEEEK